MASNTFHLGADEIDDILYLTRTNDSAELLPYLAQLSQQHSVPSCAILEACVDQDSGNTAIHYAAANGSTDLLTSLLNLFTTASAPTKPLVNAKNTAGNTPLHWAALNGHAATVTLLTASGADVWVKNAAGNLPVFEAERAAKDDVVAVLLLAGGKEVEDELRAKEGVAAASEGVDDQDMDEGDAVAGGSGADADGADEAADKLASADLNQR